MALPIRFKEVVQLPLLGVPLESIAFTTTTLESQKYVCVRDVTQADKYIFVIDLETPSKTVRTKINAESAIMNPTHNHVALRSAPNVKQSLQIFDMEAKEKIAAVLMSEIVEFWKWIDNDTLGLVTATSVYHWPIQGGNGKPTKIFGRHESLEGYQIINYQVDPTGKWCVLVGIGKKEERIVGTMQLYSIEKSISQQIEGHAATFIRSNIDGAERTLLCFGVRNQTTSRLFIVEVGSTDNKFARKMVDIYYPPEAALDFPVAMQASEKYKVIYLVTKFGYLHIFHITTGKLLYMNRISGDTIFVTAPFVTEGGIIGVNKKGQVLTVSIDPETIVTYIKDQLKEPELARQFALENGLFYS
eukprot:TRINITY_DN3133_c0_g4_i1.p1 TRINITY_DN3133_c0_g4~~TRINITY_DN3133_c0_g4_i1.p1  ORF type:complete len:359 (+),score=52.99 TRINITY_DN3133_c0_g4_i1:153-1229(+)